MEILKFYIIVMILFFTGCAHHFDVIKEDVQPVYVANKVNLQAPEIIQKYMPAFIVYEYGDKLNRIGKPSVKFNDGGDVEIFVDADKPSAYYLEKSFSTDKAHYTNLIYRIHFSKIPFSLFPFNLTYGKNVGLIVVVTLDEDENPVLVTTVHACGCYVAITPTSFLPDDSFPVGWKGKGVNVYGEKLPGLLDYRGVDNPRLLVHLRPEVHRVMDLSILNMNSMSSLKKFNYIETSLLKIGDLEKLSADNDIGNGNGNGVLSFYYEDGMMKGYVKGAIKPLETLLIGIVSFDFFVGTDKNYSDSSNLSFYTSLKPWNRKKSDMRSFGKFLNFWGWRL